ncbi:glu-tRNAGln amidotransferase C subunit domain-containing protein [Phthorimaea operculella]|nr:glu-tRNAGln amidotransferase C subunit domain-containing protein [Phthorimaea operculella]
MSSRLGLISYTRFKTIRLISRGYSSKVPSKPVVPLVKQEQTKVNVDKNTIALLERLSLVKFDSEEGVKVLEDSIAFADKILHINTDGVQPLYSVLENENLNLRADEITQGNCQKEILKNAAVVEDDYFVAPPGNIPLHEVEIEDKEKSTQKLVQNAKSTKS